MLQETRAGVQAGSGVSHLKVIPKYNAQVVQYLEELLADAKAGKITEMVATYRLSGGEFSHCWTGAEDLQALVGALERQKHLMLRRMDGD